jgi:hypothetical protein
VFGLLGALALFGGLPSAGCKGKPHGGDHHAAEPSPALPPPTPDTTPIEVLRTPAGLVLKIDGSTTPSPTASPAPTPSPAK